ncbi:lipocalin family protein [Mesonia ostreae]|uniref:Lipocalin family protein n=1 Tax=Mesonia ostreae TaxID=861110 RepID=A0ABU2KJW2_9FLAO|nr:lipocalin family protein [Mesonia ostreae]MDT0294953.1 lipocalin family protein [Mesonia ostreae]
MKISKLTILSIFLLIFTLSSCENEPLESEFQSEIENPTDDNPDDQGNDGDDNDEGNVDDDGNGEGNGDDDGNGDNGGNDQDDGNGDDDEPSVTILGNWNLIAKNGDPNSIMCPVTMNITETSITENEYYGNNCEQLDSLTDPYNLNGIILTIQTDVEDFVMEITTLTETDMVLETNDPDTNELTILSYERI